MSLAAAHSAVTVWMADGLPARIVWNGVRYRVSDQPTELVETIEHPLLTHPAERVVGWRFQGTDDEGRSHVFDVRPRSEASWDLLRVWD